MEESQILQLKAAFCIALNSLMLALEAKKLIFFLSTVSTGTKEPHDDGVKKCEYLAVPVYLSVQKEQNHTTRMMGCLFLFSQKQNKASSIRYF